MHVVGAVVHKQGCSYRNVWGGGVGAGESCLLCLCTLPLSTLCKVTSTYMLSTVMVIPK